MITIEHFLTAPGQASPDLISKAKAALGKLEDGAQPAIQRGDYLHDGRLRLNGR